MGGAAGVVVLNLMWIVGRVVPKVKKPLSHAQIVVVGMLANIAK